MKFTFAPESKPLAGYTIKRAIYRGGFGEVYYALTDAGREVALKLLQNNTEIELRGVQQCLNLSHPNLVTIFDIRQDPDGDHWIVMEYVPGETLDRAVRRNPHGMPMEEVRKWFPGMAAGVQFLHDQGLVHRDLKPANVFSDAGCVKVGDVGLSKFITPSRRSAQTQSVGTVYYMAPEVAKGRYGKEVDIYALGVILYEMLTGRAPFDGDSTGEILMKHLTEKPDLDKLPPRIRPVIGRALEKDPARRFSSVTAMAAAFDDAVLGRRTAPEPARFVGDDTPPGGLGRATPPPRPRRFHADAPNRHASRRWTRPESTTTAGDMATSLARWLCLAIFFGWMGVSFMVPVAVCLAVFFGLAVAWISLSGVVKFVGRTFFGVFADVNRAARTAQRAAFGAAAAGGMAARTVASVPFAAGRFVRRTAQFLESVLRGWDVATPLPPAMTRVAHWTGTAALAPVVVAVLSVAMMILSPLFSRSAPFGDRSPNPWEIDLAFLASFGVSALLASWAITFVCKFWEGRTYAPIPRRISLAAAGLGVGAVAWHVQQYLAPASGDVSLLLSPRGMEHLAGMPIADWLGGAPAQVSAMMVLALLFGLRSWSRQTSEIRPKRVRIISVLGTVALAAIIAGICNSDPEKFMTWAAVVSSTVQVCSVQRRLPAPAAVQAA